MFKKIIIKILKAIFIIFALFFKIYFANSNFENDYTLIDCVTGDDNKGVVFNSNKPFKTLKSGIENTINYINNNINIYPETASGKIFNIKINCSAINLLDGKIILNFKGKKYNNELVIEGLKEDSFIIKNSYFYLPNESGNIKIINANFLAGNKYNYYFLAEEYLKKFNSSGIKIIDSNIELNKGYHMSYDKNTYRLARSANRSTVYITYYYYNNEQLIYNSNIKIIVDDDYVFSMPVLIKDSKIIFENTGTGQIHNIKFLPTHNSLYSTQSNFSTFISNEIDLGGNNFSTINNINFSYINNKFINFNEFIFGNDLINTNYTIFINNFVDNKNSIDITKSINLFNNIFSKDFINSYDTSNYRKNFIKENNENSGISWIFKRNKNYDYFDLDFSSSSLFEEITGKTIPISNQEIYIIYQ